MPSYKQHQDSLSWMLVPRYLYLWTSSTAWSLTTTEGVTDRCLRKSINTSMIVKNLPKPWKWPGSAAEIQRKHQHLLGGQTPWIRASLWQVTNGVIYSADKFVKWYGWSNNYRDRIHVQSLSGEAWAWGIWPFSNHKDERQSSCGRGQRGMMREGLIWGLYLWSMAASVMMRPYDSRWPPATSADEADRYIWGHRWTYREFLWLLKLSSSLKNKTPVFSLQAENVRHVWVVFWKCVGCWAWLSWIT